MLKTSRIPVVLIALIVFFPDYARADTDIVYLAYEHAVLEPETFDDYARRTISPHSDEFFDCLADVQKGLIEAYSDAIAHCDDMPPEYILGCKSNDISFYSGALSKIGDVVRGTVSWPITVYGQNMILNKNLARDFYMRQMEINLQILKPALTCKSWWQFWK